MSNITTLIPNTTAATVAAVLNSTFFTTTTATTTVAATTTTEMPSNPFGGAPGEEATDALWVILATFIIFTMQSGFGLLESGMVSRKSESNVMVKNTLDVCLGGIMFWFVGYGFAFGPDSEGEGVNKFSGRGHFITDVHVKNDGHIYAKMFFQLSFSTAATTIVSGAVAERINLGAYMIFAAINTGLVYVFPVHWMWGGGWLSDKSAFDFAGSSVVHMSGGAAAIVGSILLGPRHNRFIDERKYQMSSPTNVILGTFFLWWGWIGFNCGSTFALSGGVWKIASKVAIVTMNGAMAGGVSGVVLGIILYHRRKYIIDIPELASGILGGLVGVTACAPVIRPWEGLFIGFVGGFIANGASKLLCKLKIDDPVGAFGVHYAAGFWSMIATGLFAEIDPFSEQVGLGEDGAFKGGHGYLLGINIAACLAITLWSGGMSFIVFGILKLTMGIRMDPEDELRGSDEVEHNIHEAPVVHETKHVLGKKVEHERNGDSIHIQPITNHHVTMTA